MRRFGKRFGCAAFLLMAVVVWAIPVRAATAAEAAPSTQPAQATSAPAAGSSNIVLKEDPTLRIWGMSPRHLLHVSIGAIVVYNVIGWSVLIYAIRRTAKASKQSDPVETGHSA